MKHIKNLLLGIVLLLIAITFDNHFKEVRVSRFKQAVMWWVVALLMVVVVRVVLAQAFQAVPSNQCAPAMVFWHTDSLKVQSVACVDFRKDKLILIPHIVNGNAKEAVVVPKPAVDSVVLLRAGEKAVMRPPPRG